MGGLVVPQQFIYGLAFNTETWGANPTGVDGPYDSTGTPAPQPITVTAAPAGLTHSGWTLVTGRAMIQRWRFLRRRFLNLATSACLQD